MKHSIVLNAGDSYYCPSILGVKRYFEIAKPELSLTFYSRTCIDGKWVFPKETPDSNCHNFIALNKDLGDKLVYGKGNTAPWNNEEDLAYSFLKPFDRMDPIWVQVVSELGEKAGINGCKLFVDEFEGEKYRIIDAYYGECVETPDSIEWKTVNKNIVQ